MSTRLSRLIQLNAKTTGLLEFQRPDEPSSGLGMTAAGVGGAGVIGGGLYARGRMAQKNFIGPVAGKSGIFGTMGQGASSLGSDASRGWNAATAATGRAGSYAKAAGSEIGGAAKGLWGKLRGLRFSSRHEKLVQLNEKLDGVIELGFPGIDPRKINEIKESIKKSKVGKAVAKQGIARGALIGGAVGLAGGLALVGAGKLHRKQQSQ